MAGGLGPNAILPYFGDITTDIGGYRPSPGHQQPYNPAWGPQSPIDVSGQTWQYGTRGLFSSQGPQSTQYDPSAQWNQISTPVGMRGALYGGEGGMAGFGEGAYSRYNDAGNSYMRRYATDVTGPGGNLILASPERGAGYRSGALFGGRNGFDNPYTGSDYTTHRDFAGLAALQQGSNPFLNDPRIQAQTTRANEQDSPFARADPLQYMLTARAAEQGIPQTGELGNQYIGQAGDVGGRYIGQAGQLGGSYVGQANQLGNAGVQGTLAAGQPGLDMMSSSMGGLRGQGVNDVSGMTNAFQNQLLDQITQQGQKDLSLGMQDTMSSMAAMGLGRSGQAQSTAGGMWNDIQQKNSLQRQNIMSQFAESAMGRQAEAMNQLRGQEMTNVGQAIGAQQQGGINAALAQQGGNLNALLAAQGGSLNALQGAQGGSLNALLAAQGLAGQGNESRLQRGYGAAMSGMDAYTGSLEASRAAERGALGQGFGNTLQWNQGTQGNYLQSLLGADSAALNRMTAEANAQSAGMHDYMQLQQMKDAMRSDRQAEMLGLEDRSIASQNARLNQMMQFGMMPQDWRMQLVTGVSPTGGTPSRTTPWGPMLAQGAMNLGASYINSNQPPPNPSYWSTGQQGGAMWE